MSLLPRDSLIDVDKFFGDVWGRFPTASDQDVVFAPRVDIHEQDDKYQINAELPGVDKDNLHVTLDKGTLTIQASVEDESKKEENGKVLRRERRYGSYARSFYVGNEVTDADISAKFENGVLRLDIPKPQQTTPESRRISVE